MCVCLCMGACVFLYVCIYLSMCGCHHGADPLVIGLCAGANHRSLHNGIIDHAVTKGPPLSMHNSILIDDLTSPPPTLNYFMNPTPSCLKASV